MQRMALKREKNFAFSEDKCLEKERLKSKVTLKKERKKEKNLKSFVNLKSFMCTEKLPQSDSQQCG